MKAVVVGGAGALGKVLIKDLKRIGVSPVSLDFSVNAAAENLVIQSKPLSQQVSHISSELAKIVQNTDVVGVFCTAGGWIGGNVGDENFLESISKMSTMNLESAALAAHLAVNHLSRNGVLVLTGAEAALRPQPAMVSYGMSKVSTHYLLQCVANDPTFLSKNASAFSILPVTIDTPTNRMYMPQADFDTWTKPEDITTKCIEFVMDPSNRPPSGSLLSVYTQGGKSSWTTGKAICSGH